MKPILSTIFLCTFLFVGDMQASEVSKNELKSPVQEWKYMANFSNVNFYMGYGIRKSSVRIKAVNGNEEAIMTIKVKVSGGGEEKEMTFYSIKPGDSQTNVFVASMVDNKYEHITSVSINLLSTSGNHYTSSQSNTSGNNNFNSSSSTSSSRSTSTAQNYSQNNLHKTTSAASNNYDSPSYEATRAKALAEINRQRQASQQKSSPRKKTALELENERKAFHQEHVRKNNEAYVSRQEFANQQKQRQQEQMAKFREEQRQKQLAAIQRQKEENERRQREHEARIAAQREENRQNRLAMERADAAAEQHMLNGNYIAASGEYANEFARQGNAEAAVATLALGAVFQVGSEIAKEKKRKKEEEERRAAERRRQEEERQRRQKILEQQKRQFNIRANQAKTEKKNIVQSRENFFKRIITHTKTFDVFPQANEPIYLFLVEADNDYKEYKENISFPSTIDISIKDESNLNFSPIIAVYPNSSGEYPFLKDILSGVEEKFTKRSGTSFKIYNWTRNLEEIKKKYANVGEKAMAANFIPNFPENILVALNEQPSGQNAYWGNDANGQSEISSNAPGTLNYWNSTDKPAPLKKADTTTIKKSSAPRLDYWD